MTMSRAEVLRGRWAAPVALLALLAGSLATGTATDAFAAPAGRRAPAAALYVDPGAASGGTGIAGHPFATVERARQPAHRISADTDVVVHLAGGAYLDVYGNSTAAGAVVDQWTCNGQGNQQFEFVQVSGGYGQLRAQHSGHVVAVSGGSTTAGTPDIVQQAPNGAAGSLWLPVQQPDGSYSFQNKNSGLCLDVYGGGSNLGQQLDQWPCKNSAGSNQDFTPR